MNTFPITEFFWNENEGDWHDTGKIIGYKVVAPNGKILGEGETINEAQEKAFASMYPPESAAKKLEPKRKQLAKSKS